jgi:3-phosphoshikimate 1-carboxyvinyltransferase
MGESTCDDVLKMKEAFARLGHESIYDCGSAGTVLRFLALRASRIPGVHILKGTPRLLSRPQEDLVEIFKQLGVRIEIQSDRLIIHSRGWQKPNPSLRVNREKSSQFVSGILLNAWDLDFPLKIEWGQAGVSEGYWQMSTQVVKDFGMRLEHLEKGVLIPAHSKVQIQKYQIESDLSSSFAIAAYAALNGEATFRSFPFQSLQPDKVFLQILEKMGAGVETGADHVRIFQKTPGLVSLQGVHWNLNECPDLFPVLATLCAFAKGPSRLDGAPHLVFKESNRIQKTAELLGHLGVQTKILPDGMEVHPPARLVMPTSSFSYDTDHDHRLAFAAALVESQTSSIQILHPEVVQKSFPEFWQIIDQQKVAA